LRLEVIRVLFDVLLSAEFLHSLLLLLLNFLSSLMQGDSVALKFVHVDDAWSRSFTVDIGPKCAVFHFLLDLLAFHSLPFFAPSVSLVRQPVL
jgi:hypothetical protein